MTWTEEKKALITEIKEIRKKKGSVRIGIDGRCASGKTTLGRELHAVLGGTLIHMDDFFLRPEQRTKERYREPGGNVDRERFLKEVLEPLQAGKPFAYRPFDCQTMSLQEPVHVHDTDLVIVEGSYCLHPAFRDYYDLKVFLDVDSATQLKRLERRNPDKLTMFVKRWIPYEERYFETFQIREHCDEVFHTENAF